MLILESLGKTLPGPPARVLLDAVDLVVEPGEYLAVIGESGAGKSTLLNLVAGLERPDTGQVRFGGRIVSAFDDDAATLWRRAEVGFVFQAFHVLPWLSVRDNVALPLLLSGVPAGGGRPPPPPPPRTAGSAGAPSARSPGSKRSDWRGAPTTVPACSRGANCSAWPSPARWCTGLACCWLMNRPATSMPETPGGLPRCCAMRCGRPVLAACW